MQTESNLSVGDWISVQTGDRWEDWRGKSYAVSPFTARHPEKTGNQALAFSWRSSRTVRAKKTVIGKMYPPFSRSRRTIQWLESLGMIGSTIPVALGRWEVRVKSGNKLLLLKRV